MSQATAPVPHAPVQPTPAHTPALASPVQLIVEVLERLDRRLAVISDGLRLAEAAYLSIRDAARRVGLSESTVRRAVKRGELRAGNVGSERRPTWRIKAADLDVWAGRARGTELPPPRTYRSRQGPSRHFRF